MLKKSDAVPGHLTIVLVHKGASDYLEVCIRLLVKTHGYRVVLIGDAANQDLAIRWGAEHAMMDQYRDKQWEEEEFGFVYNSYLPLAFEKFCFLRFNILLGYVNDVGLDRFVYLDSDIMVLNRLLLENFDSLLPYLDVVSLSDMSTFFSGWTRSALSEFVMSFPAYFKGEPWGDRHCDMFAFKRFLAQRSPDRFRSTLVQSAPVYDRAIAGGDPNFSFAPLVMRWSGVWGYDELQKTTPDISGFIKIVSGRYFIQFPQSTLLHRLDFVHLNGYLKAYLPTIVEIAFGEDAKLSSPSAVPATVASGKGTAYEPLLWEIVAELYRGILRREGEPRWHKMHVDNLKKNGLRGSLAALAQSFLATEEFLKRNRLKRLD